MITGLRTRTVVNRNDNWASAQGLLYMKVHTKKVRRKAIEKHLPIRDLRMDSMSRIYKERLQLNKFS